MMARPRTRIAVPTFCREGGHTIDRSRGRMSPASHSHHLSTVFLRPREAGSQHDPCQRSDRAHVLSWLVAQSICITLAELGRPIAGLCDAAPAPAPAPAVGCMLPPPPPPPPLLSRCAPPPPATLDVGGPAAGGFGGGSKVCGLVGLTCEVEVVLGGEEATPPLKRGCGG